MRTGCMRTAVEHAVLHVIVKPHSRILPAVVVPAPVLEAAAGAALLEEVYCEGLPVPVT